jgi:hypothetical protein
MAVAAASGQLGGRERAAGALEKMLALWGRPADRIRDELVQRHAFAESLADHLMEGLGKAGLEDAD